MTTAAAEKVWTAEDLMAMPDDGVRRWIINGQLREQPSEFEGVTMTVRNRHHGELVISIGAVIKAWRNATPEPRGKVYGGEVGVRLPGRPTAVGIDVAYVSPDVVAVQDDEKTTLLDGVPTLVVEILSPNDTRADLREKVREYLKAGVPLVWHVDPDERTVKVFQPGAKPQFYNDTDSIPEHPAMPGFAPAVAELFE